mmetsp:Transcript_16300/g.48534  ORF Transcript_16300/g.48534 Transcript_16300/m.48534 type:complete len:274 (-) Transcript_16300:322-1143(-)
MPHVPGLVRRHPSRRPQRGTEVPLLPGAGGGAGRPVCGVRQQVLRPERGGQGLRFRVRLVRSGRRCRHPHARGALARLGRQQPATPLRPRLSRGVPCFSVRPLGPFQIVDAPQFRARARERRAAGCSGLGGQASQERRRGAARDAGGSTPWAPGWHLQSVLRRAPAVGASKRLRPLPEPRLRRVPAHVVWAARPRETLRAFGGPVRVLQTHAEGGHAAGVQPPCDALGRPSGAGARRRHVLRLVPHVLQDRGGLAARLRAGRARLGELRVRGV